MTTSRSTGEDIGTTAVWVVLDEWLMTGRRWKGEIDVVIAEEVEGMVRWVRQKAIVGVVEGVTLHEVVEVLVMK